MPQDAKTEAKTLQKQYYGKPEELADYLTLICLNKTAVVYELFMLLDDNSTLDVGCRFIKKCNYFQLVKTRKGLFLCQKLYQWLTELKTPISQPLACAGNAATLIFLKTAIDNAKPEPDKDEPTDSPYYTIDEGIVLSEEAIGVLDKIGVEYNKKIGKKFNVNSGTRDAYRQAAAMYVKYGKDKTFSEYGNRAAINEILAAIKNAQAAGKTGNAVVQAMADAIQNQIGRNIFISNHLKAGCIDIAVNASPGVQAMSAAERKAMIETAIKVTGGQAFYETNPPHIHIQFK